MRSARTVRVVAATLAAVAFVSGFGSLLPFPDNEHTRTSIELALNKHEYRTPVPALRFIVTATSLNPVERRLQATLALVPDTRNKGPVFVDANHRPVLENGSIRPEFAEANLTVVLRNTFVGETKVSYPLAHVIDPFAAKDTLGVTVSIPAEIDPTQFPNDVYFLDLNVSVLPPPGILAGTPPNTRDGVPPATIDLPVVFGVALDDRLSRWSLDTNRVTAVAGDAVDRYSATHNAPNIKVSFSRGWTYWAFIYSVSLMPAVIGLSFFVRTRRRGVGSNDTSAAMELAAALLALIALRQVFVPTDIVGLTRLDFVLGVQLLAVCWLMAVTYVADPPAPPSPHTPKSRPHEQGRLRGVSPRVPDGAVRRIT